VVGAGLVDDCRATALVERVEQDEPGIDTHQRVSTRATGPAGAINALAGIQGAVQIDWAPFAL
jgi:hypothetical protein